MRISMDKADRGYNTLIGPRAKIFLDGEEVKNCVTADEELGLVICYLVEENKLITRGGRFVMIERHGAVRIVIDLPQRLFPIVPEIAAQAQKERRFVGEARRIK